MKLYMQLFFLMTSIAGTEAITIKVENKLAPNLEINYFAASEQDSKKIRLGLGKAIKVISESPTVWGPIQFTYNKKTYKLRYQNNNWDFQIVDPETGKSVLETTQPNISIHDAELAGFVLLPYGSYAEIRLKTSISEDTIRYIDEEIQRLERSLKEGRTSR